MFHTKAIASLALAVLCAPAFAGSVFQMTSGQTATVAQTLYAQDGMLRMEVGAMAGARPMTMIFRGDEMLVVNTAERTFYRITRETIAALGATIAGANEQMSAAMQQMQAQLANLPPEQRAMMERMMKDRMPNLAAMTQAAAPTIRVERGAGDQVAGYACVNYAVFVNEARNQELCAADFEALPGGRDVVAAMRTMAEFFAELRNAVQSPLLAAMQNNPFEVMSEIDGFPVRTRIFVNGAMQEEVVLSSAESRDIDPASFEVPAGFSEQSMMPGGNPFQ